MKASAINPRALAIIAGVGLVTVGNASTNTFTVSSLNISIPDDGYNGTPASMASVNLPVSLTQTVQKVTVTVGITHTWVGDLVIKVRSPAGTMVTLVSRPGLIEAADNGTDGIGDSSNLSGNFPITFDDLGAVSAENMGSTIADGGVVCQNDGQCTFAPNAGAAAAGSLSAFNGQTAAGTWTLLVGDGTPGDTGTINQFSLTIVTPVPPATNFVAASIYHAVEICWPTETGHYYQVQWASSVNTNLWTNFGNEITGNGLTNCAFDTTRATDRRFYRVQSRQ